MLPNAIQTPLSIVPSLRRTLSDYGIRSKTKGGADAMALQRRPDSTELVPAKAVPTESSSELKGKLSLHGYNLLQAALLESQSSNPESRPFSRQLYLDSVSYLLQGLPSDLSDREVLHIQKAIPAEVKVAPLSLEAGDRSVGQHQHASKPPSILHRSLASIIVMLCVIIRLFLPYLKYFVQAAYKYDREHQVSEKFLATGVQATDALGKRALEVATTALGSEMVMETVGYCVEGVCGGVTEGLGEGLKAIGGREDFQRSLE